MAATSNTHAVAHATTTHASIAPAAHATNLTAQAAASIQHFASTGITDVWAVVGNIFAFLAITILVAVFALRAGRHAFISLIISLYTGYALYSVFPFMHTFVKPGATDGTSALITIGVYAVLVLTSYLLVRRVSGGHSATIHFVPMLLLAILTGGFIMALGYQLFDITQVYPLPKTLDLLFAPKQYFFWWFVAPLVGIFILAR